MFCLPEEITHGAGMQFTNLVFKMQWKTSCSQDQNNGFFRRPHNASGDHQGSTQQTTQGANVSTSSQNPETQPFVSTQWNMNQGTAGFYVNAHTQILLQTARAIVSRPDQSQSSVNARILFDLGSQRTFMPAVEICQSKFRSAGK